MAEHRSSIGTSCIIFPDTNIIVHAALHDKEFKEKIDFFESGSQRHAVRNELLPKVHEEVIRRLSIASQRFLESLRDFKVAIADAAGKSIDTVAVDELTFKVVEKGMGKVAAVLSTKYASNPAVHAEAIGRARIVETVLVSKLRGSLDSKTSLTMGDLIKQIEEEYAQLYMRFWDEVIVFLKKINGILLKPTELLRTKAPLRQRFTPIRNPHDITILCQAVSRMFATNSWAAIATVDYSDIVRNSELIQRETLLMVCDPLYAFSHLEDAIASKQRPKDEAKTRGISIADFVEFPALPRCHLTSPLGYCRRIQASR
jgi:hypothetical protein